MHSIHISETGREKQQMHCKFTDNTIQISEYVTHYLFLNTGELTLRSAVSETKNL